MRDVKCPSGQMLTVQAAPFEDSKSLYQALLKEIKFIDVKEDIDPLKLMKDVFCAGFSSSQIDHELTKCFKRCTYADKGIQKKIDMKTSFESDEGREDYLFVCMEVIKENVSPFLKHLSAQFSELLEMSGMSQNAK
jgi:hypothetical protein